MLELRRLTAMRYVLPLREGGSLPAIVEADDGALYVMKFIGSGQGVKALIAEVLAGAIGVELGLNVPELVLLELDPRLGRSEPNPDIQDLLRASTGLNLGLRYLPGSFAYNLLLRPPPLSAGEASSIVWFDSYISNVDRTPRNVNMLLWEHKLWLIDHGASLYFHHTWKDVEQNMRARFAFVRQHTLIGQASRVREVDAGLRARLPDATLGALVGLLPDVWLEGETTFASAAEHRAAYAAYLRGRRDAADAFVEEAATAHAAHAAHAAQTATV